MGLLQKVKVKTYFDPGVALFVKFMILLVNNVLFEQISVINFYHHVIVWLDIIMQVMAIVTFVILAVQCLIN